MSNFKIKYMLLGICIANISHASQLPFHIFDLSHTSQPTFHSSEIRDQNENAVQLLGDDILGIYLANSYNMPKQLSSDKEFQEQKRKKYIESYNRIFKSTVGEEFYKCPQKYKELWILVRKEITATLSNRNDIIINNLAMNINKNWNIKKFNINSEIIKERLEALTSGRNIPWVTRKIIRTVTDLFMKRENYGNLLKRLEHILKDLKILGSTNYTEKQWLNVISRINKNIDSLRHSRGQELFTYFNLIIDIKKLLWRFSDEARCRRKREEKNTSCAKEDE